MTKNNQHLDEKECRRGNKEVETHVFLVGVFLGFGTSFLPKILGYFEGKRDNAHELAMIAAQPEAQVKLEGAKLEAMHVGADISGEEALLKHDSKLQSRAWQWVVNLAATVRPVLSYLFFVEFFALTACVNLGWLTLEQYGRIWNDDAQAIFAAVVSFWFSSRTMARKTQT
ncbi:MAG: hypothetical protein V6Z86_08230 [Hyphomicrobiales bacterium]